MPGHAALSTARPSFRLRLTGFLRLLHPFPSLLNTIVVAVLACVAARGWPGPGRVLWLSLTMLCIQFSIGALNDWVDRALDARTKPSKPIAAGLVPSWLALTSAIGFALLAVVLASIGGPAAWILAICGLGIGVAYDLGLKRTPFSALTYALALPLIPIWVWTALERSSPALYAVLPVGMMLGVSLQLANALPDAEGDAAEGVRGTLQVLGPSRGRLLAWLTFGLALLLSVALAPFVMLRPVPFAFCWLAAVLLLVAAIAMYRRNPSRRSLQWGWTLLAPGAGILAAGWLMSLP